MTKLLLRLFVKDSRNINSPDVRTAIGKMAGITGIICNFILFAAKLAVGLLSGSISVIADSVNNLTDSAASVITLFGFRMAQQPADEDHPYGHARYEYLSGLVISVFVLFVGIELATSSVKRIITPVPSVFNIAEIIVLVISVFAKMWMFGFFGTLGKKISSTSLTATSVDCRNDVFASAAVLISCVIEYCANIDIDGFVGLAVAIFILRSGILIAKETVSPLLGKQANSELIKQINELVLENEKVLGVHDLLIHDYGPGRCFASIHVELSADTDPLICHDIIDKIECAATEKLNVNLVIHHDPIVENDAELNEMRKTVETIIAEIDLRLSMHDFRIVRNTEKTKLIFDLAVPYSMNDRHEEIKQK